MITTEFLSIKDYAKFGDWLRIQDEETRQLYFGIAGSHHIIDELMKRVLTNPINHHFLVATIEGRWIGTIHIAAHNDVVEFGLIVDEGHRGQGVAGEMLEEAILWVRNRGYKELFMHCLGWNKSVQHLCHKHGLATHNMYGDSEVELKLEPANWITINKEICIKQRNLYHMFLQNTKTFYEEIYG